MKCYLRLWKQLIAAGLLVWILLALVLLAYMMDTRAVSLHLSTFYKEDKNVSFLLRYNTVTSTAEETAFSMQNKNQATAQHKAQRVGEKSTLKDKNPSDQSLGKKLSLSNKEVSGKALMLNQKKSDKSNVTESYSQKRFEQYRRWRVNSLTYKLWKGEASAHMLNYRLQTVLRNYISLNEHQVAFRGELLKKQSREELQCQLKKQLQLLTLDGKEPPFSMLGWKNLVPQQPLDQLYGSPVKTCAVVSSAGAILRSYLGKEIDDHDVVLRFNAAPTQGFKNDVGEKTSIRIINSQILVSSTFNTSRLYKDVVLVAWDPSPYVVDLQKWYEKPDYNLFSPYEQHRKLHPLQPFYILHPKFIWKMWDIIQGNTHEIIQPNPPSSGFIGIVLMMALCEKVDVYEYIPSERQTPLCHYYEWYFDDACTLGAYHPLLYEKMLIQRMNIGSEHDLKEKGKATLPGFSAMNCGS